MSAILRQATLSFRSSGRNDANRPGPRPKAPTTLSAAASAALIYGAAIRRRVGRIYEKDLDQSLENSRAYAAAAEPDSDDSEAEAESDSDYQPRPKARQNANSREKMLAVIT